MMKADRRRSSNVDMTDEETIELIPTAGPQQRRSTVVNANGGTGGGGLASAPTSGNAPLTQLTTSATMSKPPVVAQARQSTPGTNAPAFNPRLIFSQMVALQSFHYLTLGFLIQCNHVVFATSITIDRIFTSKYYDITTGQGWVDNGALLCSSLVGAVLLALIVEKSKKCLDFSVTLFFIHFVACCLYGGAPSTYSWWIIHIAATVLMTLLGEYLCSIREMNEIPLLPQPG